MPSEDQDQTWENDNEKSEFESIFLKFRFPINVFEQADPTTSWTQKGIEMFYDQDVPWLVRKGSRYEVRKGEYGHTWYLSFFLHSHILSHENFTLGKCVNLRQICPATKQLSVELHTVECKTTHRMYHYTYIYPSDVKLHAKGEIKHQV